MAKKSAAITSKGCAESGTSKHQNLIDLLFEARQSAGWSMTTLAKRAEVSARAIHRLERGVGSSETLMKVMEALDFCLIGAGKGSTLHEQLKDTRQKKSLSIAKLSARTGLSRTTISQLEEGRGSVASLLRLMSVLAPRAKRPAPERAYWAGDKKGGRDLRFTPADFMMNIYEAFGEVDLDPCGNELSPVIAHRTFLLDKGDDGLRDAWLGKLAFVNPPFSELLTWLERAHDQWSRGNVETVVALVPVRTDSATFHGGLSEAADIFLLKGRVKFLDPGGKSQATPFSLMVLTLGATAKQKARYSELVEGRWFVAQ